MSQQFGTGLPAANATRYAVHFTLPDGEHLLAVLSHPSVIRTHLAQLVVEHNERLPDTPIKITKWYQATVEMIDEAAAAINMNNPDRLTVDERYGANRNRLLYENREKLLGEALPDEDEGQSRKAIESPPPSPISHPQNTFFPVPVRNVSMRDVGVIPQPVKDGEAKPPPDLADSLE